MNETNAPKGVVDLFQQAYSNHASDLHILVGRKPIFRIDGILHEVTNWPVMTGDGARDFVGKVVDKKDWDTFMNERELDISYEVPGVARFRVNALWEKGNVSLVARVITPDPPTMEELMMPQVVYELIRLHQGLILVTGPTGCGKSTSLAAMINLINIERSENIVTLEDPIEFIHASKKSIIRQRELGHDTYSFSQALKHVVRQDPNVILIGEMRDLETIAAAMTIAETGHLVLATLHTISAAQTVDRIIDVFPPYQQDQIRLQLSLVLRGVISQQLIAKADGGRIAAREIMMNTPAISNLIRENKIAQIRTVIQTSANSEMITMDQDLKRLYKDGYISQETTQMYMLNPQDLESRGKLFKRDE
ncbi:MAG: hypothetical protein A3F54_02405 [Candidatus Kerfeldbacteria bacterium RIFCSPHIGHO2_12_FULL_48_17]|uniref:Bacterial type II secretion system protein E domain-containing protein n=1 Tax=Candidatus Kerfeldbacteria bacterium RIFCSPHIGHO2_12_FULL_48_17 TaxID=1798542 RepID=A0A1G2BA78_9BACT|nr:MAG: hypothetical protein A3F54_02405 [Candidatus Kerfeldbacteria bacterium RIFCSPHIGHO2_12_FULL_48_17]